MTPDFVAEHERVEEQTLANHEERERETLAAARDTMHRLGRFESRGIEPVQSLSWYKTGAWILREYDRVMVREEEA